MWNRSKSLMLSIFCTRLFLLLLVLGVCFAHVVVQIFLGPDMQPLYWYFQITIYCCFFPACLLLLCLHKLLLNIRKERVFQKENTKMLRIISWCCIAVGVITAASSIYEMTFMLVAVGCAFFGLIIRVIKNVFEQAIVMKDDYDFTI